MGTFRANFEGIAPMESKNIEIFVIHPFYELPSGLLYSVSESVLALRDAEYQSIWSNADNWFNSPLRALERGKLNSKHVEWLLGISFPATHEMSALAPSSQDELPSPVDATNWDRLLLGRRWHNFTKQQPRATARLVREKRVETLLTPMRLTSSGGLRSEDLCSFGNLEYYKPFVKAMWLAAPMGCGAMAQLINRLIPRFQAIFDEELAVCRRLVKASMGWRLIVKSLATPEEIDRSRFFLDRKEIADPVLAEMRDELRQMCASTGDELGVVDDKFKSNAPDEEENIEHVARMAVELGWMMSAAAVGRRSLKATGMTGKGPDRPIERKPLFQEARAQREAQAQRIRAWRLDLESRGFDPLEFAQFPRYPDKPRKRPRRSVAPVPGDRPVKRRGRPPGTTKEVMARRRQERSAGSVTKS